MHLRSTVLAILAFSGASMAAQWSVGCRAGLNLATISGDVEDEFLTMNPGLHAAADVELGLGKWLGLRSGIAYTMKGARWSYDRENAEGEESGAHDDTKASYLEIPLSLQFRPPVSWKIKPYVSFGPALGLFLGAQKTVKVDGEEVYSATRNEGARNVDLGLTAGGGAGVRVGPGEILLEVCFTWGLLTVDASGDEYVVNRALSITLGYSLPLGRREAP